MSIRAVRKRRTTGLRHYIDFLLSKPIYRFLDVEDEMQPVKQLIYGPGTSRPSKELVRSLEALWREIGADILAAGEMYGVKPWGATRFDS